MVTKCFNGVKNWLRKYESDVGTIALHWKTCHVEALVSVDTCTDSVGAAT